MWAASQVADPIILSARVCDPCECRGGCDCFSEGCVIPDCICRRFGGPLGGCRPEKVIYVTIGVFTIIQLERNVQMLIPVYDFCIPDKECTTTTDNPCDLFQKIRFPVEQFFPPKAEDVAGEDDGYHGCCK